MTTTNDASLSKARCLLGLQFLSDFGDQITCTLIALSILDISQSTTKVGSVYLFTTLGYVLFTFVGGVLGDSVGRRNILCAADIGRCLVVLLLVLAVREKSLTLIYASSFLLSMLGSIHGPVKISVWAEAVPRNLLERYNSLSELSVQSSTILGPLIAAFFISHRAIDIGFFVDASTFLICAFVVSRIVTNNMTVKKNSEKKDFLEGFKIIFTTAEIKKYVYYDAIQMIGFGAFNATLLILVQRDFGFTKSDYSLHLAIIALFATASALVGATKRSAQINPVIKLTVCSIISAVTLYAAIGTRSFPLTSIFVGICDGFVILTMAVARTNVQIVATQMFPRHLASVIAARAIVIKAATLLGVGICLFSAEFLSLETTLKLLIIPIGLSFIPILPTEMTRILVTRSMFQKTAKKMIDIN